MDEAQLALEKSAGESSSTETGLQAQVVAVKKSLSADKTRVKRLEHGNVAEAKKK